MNRPNKQLLIMFTSTLLVIISIIVTSVRSLSKSTSIDQQPVKKTAYSDNLRRFLVPIGNFYTFLYGKKAIPIEPSRSNQIIKNNNNINKIKKEIEDAGIIPREAKYWKKL